MKNGVNNVLRYGAATACFVLYVFSYALYERTLIEWWLPVTVAAVAAALTAAWCVGLWANFTGSDSRLFNYACHLFFAGAVAVFAFLGGNRIAIDESAAYEKKFTVTERIAVTRNRYRRVGRRSVRSGSYKAYYLRLRSEDGAEKKVPVALSLYSKVRENGTVTYSVCEGRFGFPIIL